MFQLLSMNKIKLAIVSDHEEFRETMIQSIHLEGDLQVVLKAENGVQLLELLKATTVEVILMDIRVPKKCGFKATEQLRRLYPEIKIIALMQYDMEVNIVEMNIRGVKSFVGKENQPGELFKAIRITRMGGYYMTTLASKIIQKHLAKSKANELPILNDFEMMLLQLICKGT